MTRTEWNQLKLDFAKGEITHEQVIISANIFWSGQELNERIAEAHQRRLNYKNAQDRRKTAPGRQPIKRGKIDAQGRIVYS